jgi:hypothetical protein
MLSVFLLAVFQFFVYDIFMGTEVKTAPVFPCSGYHGNKVPVKARVPQAPTALRHQT